MSVEFYKINSIMDTIQAQESEFEKFLSRLHQHLSISLFFVKPVPIDYYPITVKGAVTSEEDDGQRSLSFESLGSEHFNLLWIIESLCKVSKLTTSDEHKYPVVRQEQLQKVFLWYTKVKSSFLDKLRYMSNELISTGFLGKIVEGNKRYFWVTPEGREQLEENRKKREAHLARFFELSGIKKESYSEIEDNFKKITPVLWRTIIKEAEGIKLPKKPQGRKPRKKPE